MVRFQANSNPFQQFPAPFAHVKPVRGQVDFVFEGNDIRGLEQNRQTKSRWASMARCGMKVMQFLSETAFNENDPANRGW